MGGRTAEGYRSGGSVVDVGHTCRGAAGHALCSATQIGIAGPHADGLADLCLGQGQSGAGCAVDVDPIGQPLVADRAHQTIDIAGRGRQDLTLGRRAADTHRAVSEPDGLRGANINAVLKAVRRKD